MSKSPISHSPTWLIKLINNPKSLFYQRLVFFPERVVKYANITLAIAKIPKINKM
jgi:hypothetical protein